MSEYENQSVLIVDDSVQYAAVLRRILEAGFGMRAVQHCTTIAAAQELLMANPAQFTLLFVDFRFPEGKTGVELIEDLRGLLPPETVQLLITSEPTPENVRRSLAAGAKGVVAKPFDRAQLATQLKRAFKPLSAAD